jgi:hypothetical protein
MPVEGGKGAKKHVVANREVKNATIGVLGEEDVPQSLISFEGLMLNTSGCKIITVNGMGGWFLGWLPSRLFFL